MGNTKVQVETEKKPTESTDKVRKTLENLFGTIPFQTKHVHRKIFLGATLTNRAGLSRLRILFRNDRIRDSARKILLTSLRENTISFCLNKQVAFVNHVSFCEETAESPLGPIRIIIETDDPKKLINWLSPRTNRTRG